MTELGKDDLTKTVELSDPDIETGQIVEMILRIVVEKEKI